MLRCGQKSIIFLINNGGYTIEVEIHDGPYNVTKNWNYTALVDAIHDGEGKCWTAKVCTETQNIYFGHLIYLIENITYCLHYLSHINELKMVCILYNSLKPFFFIAIWFRKCVISGLYVDIDNKSNSIYSHSFVRRS